MQYQAKRIDQVPELNADWQAPVWQNAEIGRLTYVRPESSDHVPQVQFRLLHDASNIYGIYQVKDRYVRGVITEFQGSVCTDSCVEFFFKPNEKGYFNLEMSANGTFLIYFVRNHVRNGEGYKDFSILTAEEGKLIQIKSSLPALIDPEISEPTTWTIQFVIPKKLVEIYAGPMESFNNTAWTANFYKCADHCSHPHWITWNPIPETNYHLPEYFGSLILE